MKVTLITDIEGENYTSGNLYVDNEWLCHTLEDKNRDTDHDGKLNEPKVFGKTAIPYGVHEMTLVHSPHFNMMVPLICGVPGFTAIEIHPGNTVNDTNGCILVGIRSEKGDTLKFGTSRAMFAKLMEKLTNSNQKTFQFEKKAA